MDEKIVKLISDKKLNEAKVLAMKTYFLNKKKYYYYLGLCYCAEGKYSEAIEKFLKAEKLGLKHYLLYYNLGTAYIEINKLDNAKECLKKSIELNNNYNNSFLNLAYIYIKEKNLKAAYRIIKSVSCFNDVPLLYEIEENIYKELIK
ncbi:MULTISPECIES: tetratricopeptide repeat protein [Caloramator]|jgi:tetratricopeptide (TPR) repeat protein|uniref:COG0457: FOG: TPR repeat n=1 Tax=Caloramator australicus RC3 TaxID=857293 RepID=I7LI32_9CLOT|nr:MULTISPECIES: tetratricopeptide repeat protein [Caloramator]MDO6355429.1 tetratricopeptide repeat protein [Caloramator sp. CAR-1]CCJ32622.1 COG0457: FOG: TPR repeat [Caloramator australicus RC3]